MKHKIRTFALAALFTSTAFGAMPDKLPEFKTPEQLAQWREEMATKAQASSTTNTSETHAFYTGKPYLASTGTYAFKYRSYNPELARWTSEDPSGFPDGANGSIYAPTPTREIDWQGLEVKMVFSINSKTLTATDLATNATMTITNVLSGSGASANVAKDDWKKDIGPIPRGDWLVGQQQSNDWYRLYGPNGQGGYSYTHVEVKDPEGNAVVRNGFNLHEGTVSLGCVTVTLDSQDWLNLENMLNNTATFNYNGSAFTARLKVTE